MNLAQATAVAIQVTPTPVPVDIPVGNTGDPWQALFTFWGAIAAVVLAFAVIATLLADLPKAIDTMRKIVAQIRRWFGKSEPKETEPQEPTESTEPQDRQPLRIDNLPIPRTPLIGRESEIEEVTRLLLDPEVCFVTLTGAGGTGKTRLALEVASRLRDKFLNGVCFVPLETITDVNLVLPAIAKELGLRETTEQPLLESIQGYLQDKQLLLVLDNSEQLLDAAPLIVQILESGDLLKALVTSRAALNVPEEHEFFVPPLRCPNLDRGVLSFEQLASYESVHLFHDRAEARVPGFKLTEGNVYDVVNICGLVGCLPLAIELAAAQIKTFHTPEVVLRELKQSGIIDVLESGASPSGRHSTMSGAIEWSYKLLDAEAQKLFARLAVFTGGASLQAIKTVCGEGGPAATHTIRSLRRVVDSSLIQSLGQEDAEHGEPRYSFLLPIQEYALDRLHESGEYEMVRQRHADFFLALAEEAEPALIGAGQEVWLKRLDLENANIRAALEWLQTSAGRVEAGLRLAWALGPYWYVRGEFTEGRRWLEALLNAPGDVSKLVRAKALTLHGILAYNQSDLVKAKPLLEESLQTLNQLDDQDLDERGRRVKASEQARTLSGLGFVAKEEGNLEDSIKFYRNCFDIYTRIKDQWGIAATARDLGVVLLFNEEHQEAQDLFNQALTLHRNLNDQWGVVLALLYLGLLECKEEKYDDAERHLRESVELSRKLSYKRGLASGHQELGRVLRNKGDYKEAVSELTESLRLHKEQGDGHRIGECLVELAWIAQAQNNPERSAELLGAVQVVAPNSATVILDKNIELCDTLRADLGGQAFEASFNRGTMTNVEQVEEFALKS